MFFIVFQLLGIFCGIITFLEYNKSFNLASIGKVVHIGIACATVAFNLLTLKETYSHDNSWEYFFDDVKSFDYATDGYKSFYIGNAVLYYLEFGIMNTSLIIIYFLACFTTSQVITISYHRVITIIYINFVSIEMMVTTFILRSVSKILEKRHQFFIQKLRVTFLSTKTLGKLMDAQSLEYFYFLFHRMVKTIDLVLGKKILFILILTVLQILGTLQYVVLEYSQEKFRSLLLLVLTLSQVLFFLVSY